MGKTEVIGAGLRSKGQKMDYGLTEKVALVAAGSKGIGLAAAKALAAEGCRVSICSRSAENLRAAKDAIGGQVHGFVADVSKAADIDDWVSSARMSLGPISILVTNTGGPAPGFASTLTDAQWKEGFESTLMNVVRMVRAVSEDMKSAGWGRIVHNTSLVARQPSDILAISSTIRGGLMNLTRLQATELAPFGITVNGVLPGHTMTDRQVHLAEVRSAREGITVEEALLKQAAEVPMKRLGEPEEIAAAIAFLCSVGAGYVSGVNLTVDGGLTRGPA